MGEREIILWPCHPLYDDTTPEVSMLYDIRIIERLEKVQKHTSLEMV